MAGVVTRVTQGSDHWRYEPSAGLDLWLMLGANELEEPPPSDELLAAAWAVEREAMLDSCRRNPCPGWRPAAWWWTSTAEMALDVSALLESTKGREN